MTDTVLSATTRATGFDRSRAIAVGLAAGFVSGLFGVGGGILMVPAMVIGLGVAQKLAHGTSLAAVLPIGLSGVIGYALDDKVDWPVLALLAVGAVAGAAVGTHVLHLLPQRAVGYAFAALLVATAVRLLVDHSEATGRAPLSLLGAAALVLVGCATGVLAGLLGVGGGIVMVPAMVVGFGIPAAIAKGTSLGVVVPTSMMGTWRNAANGNVNMRLAAYVGLSGMVSAFGASRISVGMSEALSNVLFAVLLLAVAARMLASLRNEAAPVPAAPE
jgi:uncharacterized membrane protein YfcA